jgi:hypothetical protein
MHVHSPHVSRTTLLGASTLPYSSVEKLSRRFDFLVFLAFVSVLLKPVLGSGFSMMSSARQLGGLNLNLISGLLPKFTETQEPVARLRPNETAGYSLPRILEKAFPVLDDEQTWLYGYDCAERRGEGIQEDTYQEDSHPW